MGLVSLIGLSLASCSDDDDAPMVPESVSEPTTENVFPEGLPSNAAGATFTTNEKGQVTKIEDGSSNITFEYGSFTPSRAHNFTVLMKERDTISPNSGHDIYMEINQQGFVSYAYEVYLDGESEPDEWWFEYNNDGQLTRVKRSENEEEFNITYTNGDITKVTDDKVGSKNRKHKEYSFSYTNDEYKNVVANKGCLMLFDEIFRVQLDELEIAYFAGLLGKASKNLPMGYTEISKEGDSSYTYEVTYHWDFNADNLPTKFWNNSNPIVTTFSWK